MSTRQEIPESTQRAAGCSLGASPCSALRYRCDRSTEAKPRDVVYTPDWCAKEIIDRYKPTGKVLDPCRGDGAFWRQIPGAEWCEIEDGRDFFKWDTPMDWIIGNPPYSVMNRWLDHSMKLADNIAYLIPIAKLFGSRERLLKVRNFGLREVWAPWTGRKIGFEFGWACGVVHLQRGYHDGVTLDCMPNRELMDKRSGASRNSIE